MKNGRSIGELISEVERQNTIKQDVLAPTTAITPEEINGKPYVTIDGLEDNSHFALEDTAFSQLCTITGIPFKYAKKMLVDTPDLFSENAVRWLDHIDKTKMVRLMGDRARAILSDRYQRIDNLDMLKIALPPLMDNVKSKELSIVSCEVTPTRMYIKIVDRRTTKEVKPGDQVQAGVVISNSEVGYGCCEVTPMIYRLVCSNGMIAADKSYARKHIGARNEVGDDTYRMLSDEAIKADDQAILLKVRDVVAGSFDEAFFESTVDKLIRSTENKMKDVQQTVQVLQKTASLTDDEASGILRSLIDGADTSHYGLINAITAYSQEVLDYDRATQLEQLGGRVLESQDNVLERMLVAA